LDGSGLYTAIKGRMTVKQAIEKGLTDIPIGYPDPTHPDTFKYFKVTYHSLTDQIEIERP
jgi:hypothetical protein